ncbi:hypothetical protein ACH47Z_22690 [Streptomyces sp. NPDC020192]|uniref:hypothetical protein n=1 Tax=Streptomyces sp. NPDC020192 TaxID=3365066 RepID=UPI0037AF8AA5
MITTLAARDEQDRDVTCFVIGPIGNSYAPHGSPERAAYEHHLRVFEQVIAPACARYGMTPLRADRIAHAGDVNEQICRHVIQSDLVIADVTGGNPNVMYELGLRHITGKPTIHIGEHGQLPFDIASIRTIHYERSRSGLADARETIENALEVGLRDGFESLTPARVLRGIQPADGTPAAPGDTAEQDEEAPGLLDEFAAIEDGLEQVTEDMDTITKAIETIAALTEQHGAEIAGLAQAHVPMSARLAGLARYAESISSPADELKDTAHAFARRMTSLDSGVRAALSLVEITPPEEWGEGTDEFLRQLVDLEATAQESMAGLDGMGSAADGLLSLSRHVRKPVKNISAAVKQVVSVMACVEEWAGKARTLLERATG